MRDRLRAFIERLLPWYDRAEASRHDAWTEAITRRSVQARRRSERLRRWATTELGSYGRVRVGR